MSVFTLVERAELEAFLAPYGLGRLLEYNGIAEGSENSNFFVSLEAGEYVLTLVERGRRSDLPFVVELLQRLHSAGLPVPYAIATQSGETLRELAEKPTLLQPRLPGKHISRPNAQHCREVGQLLARLHLNTREQILEHQSDRGLDWMLSEGPLQALQLHDEQLPLLRDSLAELAEQHAHILSLPRANLHADLFRDNLLFDGPHLSGVIDFYNACAGPMLYDVAISVNDWCSTASGRLDAGRARALLGAYASLRPFTAAEANLWPTLLRVACLRFWLSRLIAIHQPAASGVHIKDPTEFQRRLQQRQQVSVQLPFAL
ncbi:MAG: homoserine kinase [Pseudomonas sp.]|nr:homoserine kinase [Pseudomonas sp.]